MSLAGVKTGKAKHHHLGGGKRPGLYAKLIKLNKNILRNGGKNSKKLANAVTKRRKRLPPVMQSCQDCQTGKKGQKAAVTIKGLKAGKAKQWHNQ